MCITAVARSCKQGAGAYARTRCPFPPAGTHGPPAPPGVHPAALARGRGAQPAAGTLPAPPAPTGGEGKTYAAHLGSENEHHAQLD